MSELRWCILGVDGSYMIHSVPTATDALEYANKALKDEDEFNCCRYDGRLKELPKVKELLSIVDDEVTINKEQTLYSDCKTEDEILELTELGSFAVVYNLSEDIKCLKEDKNLTNDLIKGTIKYLKQELGILQRKSEESVIGSYELRHYQLRIKSNKVLTEKLEKTND